MNFGKVNKKMPFNKAAHPKIVTKMEMFGSQILCANTLRSPTTMAIKEIRMVNF